jgi:hypothetical protein
MDIFDIFIGVMVFVLICVLFSPAKSEDGKDQN